MATRFINMGEVVDSPGGNVAGFAVDQNGVLTLDRGATHKGALSTDPGPEPLAVGRTIIATASFSLTAKDNGATVVLDSSTAIVVSLPATAGGLTFRFIVKTVAGSGSHAVSPVTGDSILHKGFTVADNKDLLFSGNAIGDGTTLVGDGTVGWTAFGSLGTITREG